MIPGVLPAFTVTIQLVCNIAKLHKLELKY